jgi:hypothetical protein
LLLLVALAAIGCKSDMYSEGTAEDAVAAILSKCGHESPRAYLLKVTPKQVTVRLENPKKPGTLQEWWFFEGEARGPRRVTLLGKGSIEPGLFELKSIDVGAVARMAKQARELWKIDSIRSMKLRVRSDVIDRKLRLQWYIDGSSGGKGRSVTASRDGVVQMPHALLVAKHAKAGDWSKALSLCGYFSIKHNAELAAARNKIYGPPPGN